MNPVLRRTTSEFVLLFVGAAIAWVSLAVGGYAWQDERMLAEAAADEIFIGESVDYQVEIRNAQNPVAPDMSAIKQLFGVENLGDQSRNQSSMTIINGRVTRESVFSHVYQFRLTPKDTGDLKIPAATSTIDGRELKSKELPLRVLPVPEQDSVVVEIKADQAKVYPTQPFEVSLGILVEPLPDDERTNPLRPLRRNPPHIQINWVEAPEGISADDHADWLGPLVARDGVGFTLNEVSARTDSFFGGSQAAVFDLSKGRETRNGLDGKPKRYFEYELKRRFTAEKAGTYLFGPAVVKGTFVSGIRRDEYVPRRIIAIAPALTIDVRDVPEPRPATFCGGIGDYQWSVSASPTKLRVGDPLTLTLDVRRGAKSGSLALISAPDLSAHETLSRDFELIDKNPTGRIEGSVKRFAYALRPKRANVRIPPLGIAAFDPITEKFSETSTDPIALDVTEAVQLTGGELVGAAPQAKPLEIKSSSEGIYQNIGDLTLLRDERPSFGKWSMVTAAVWLGGGSLVALLVVHRRRSSDTVWRRRAQARRAAQRRLAEARVAATRGDSKGALRLVRASILGLVADTCDRAAEGFTSADVDQTLSKAAVPVDDRKKVVELLQSIESAEYGGAQATEPSSAIASATSWVARLAPILERGG